MHRPAGEDEPHDFISPEEEGPESYGAKAVRPLVTRPTFTACLLLPIPQMHGRRRPGRSCVYQRT